LPRHERRLAGQEGRLAGREGRIPPEMIVIGEAMMVMLPHPGISQAAGKAKMIVHTLEPLRIERRAVAVA